MNIIGRKIQLDDTRSVFVGKSDGGDGLTYIEFINSEKESTRFKLSREGRDALMKLLAADAAPADGAGGQWVAVYLEKPLEVTD